MENRDLEEGMLSKRKSRIRPPPKMTSNDKQLSKKQPASHQKNKGVVESIFGTCCA